MVRRKKIILLEQARKERSSLMVELEGTEVPCGRCGKNPAIVGIIVPDPDGQMFEGWRLWKFVASCAPCISTWEQGGQATITPFPQQEE